MFTNLSSIEKYQINGGSITLATVGSAAVKFGVTWLIRQGIKYVWNRAMGL